MGSVSEVRVWPIKNPKFSIRANGVFTYNGAFQLKFSLIKGSKGDLFVSFPGKYGDKVDPKTNKKIFYPDIKCLDDDVRTQLSAAAIAEYNKATGNDSMNQGDADGPTNQTNMPNKRNIPF